MVTRSRCVSPVETIDTVQDLSHSESNLGEGITLSGSRALLVPSLLMPPTAIVADEERPSKASLLQWVGWLLSECLVTQGYIKTPCPDLSVGYNRFTLPGYSQECIERLTRRGVKPPDTASESETL